MMLAQRRGIHINEADSNDVGSTRPAMVLQQQRMAMRVRRHRNQQRFLDKNSAGNVDHNANANASITTPTLQTQCQCQRLEPNACRQHAVGRTQCQHVDHGDTRRQSYGIRQR